MKLPRIFTSLVGASLIVTLTMALVLPAQEAPPPASDTPPAPAADDMRELGAAVAPAPPTPAPAAEVVEELVGAIGAEIEQDAEVRVETASDDPARHDRDREGRGPHSGELVQFGSNALLPEGQSASNVVAILGDAVVDGESRNEVVAVLGSVTVNGSAGREAVAVMGDVVVNGYVGGEVVAVLGNVQLGPTAVVDGQIVCVGGTVDRAPGAVVNGPINQVQIPILGAEMAEGLRAWVRECLLKLRPLAFDEHLGWLWMIMLAALGFYVLLALLLPAVVTRTVETMEAYPGMSLLTALLTMVITPIAMLVLSVTVVGPFVLGIVLFFLGIFGKVVFLAWVGRRITEPAGWKFPALAVLIGGVITLGIYLVPILGFIFSKLSGFLGMGIVVYTIILAMQDNGSSPNTPAGAAAGSTASPPPPTVSTAAASGTTDSFAGGGSGGSASAGMPPLPPAAGASAVELPEQLSTLPRAGFWARFAATLIDVIALGIVVGILNIGDYFAVVATGYFIALWALKGTTLGGVVLGLKIVRVDDKPVDWAVALVRSLGAFLSLCVMGIGFLWVVWDPRRQSWHDKIAGTTIVKMPKGVSLI